MLITVSNAVKVAGSCNAVLRTPDGTLQGDMFDGEGFTRGVKHKGVALAGHRAWWSGGGRGLGDRGFAGGRGVAR
jgi:shikimate dehydrogenase